MASLEKQDQSNVSRGTLPRRPPCSNGAMRLLRRLLTGFAILLTSASPALSLPIHGQGTWETTLQARDFNADGVADGFFDTQLNIVWIRQVYRNLLPGDAVFRYNSTYGYLGDNSGPPNIRYPFAWRPGSQPSDFPNFAYQYTNNGTSLFGTAKTGVGWGTVSELGHLYYVTLGNQGVYVPDDSNPFSTVRRQPACTSVSPTDFRTCTSVRDGYGWANTGDFLDLPWFEYFFSIGDPYQQGDTYFDAETGLQFGGRADFLNTRSNHLFVIDGDWGQPLATNAVPEPVTTVLLLLGLWLAGKSSKRTRTRAMQW